MHLNVIFLESRVQQGAILAMGHELDPRQPGSVGRGTVPDPEDCLVVRGERRDQLE